ncbi:LPS export ABC transporter protein LptC [Sulfurivirga caldicuralii]|uniref:LPS export ABC transporter protein LptC n=1 Tax=Sulfurivirga caldicuralii TaxID=364032 RepID=A0A1N6G3Y0_9GAMM|nr:LPS export ABC transporter periplasmic protein LptC [Sulfurivirga caldicuralii]SIO02234.1 LPS export ABC transporter protein LptC [Sulfurivirga caldicuralii]
MKGLRIPRPLIWLLLALAAGVLVWFNSHHEGDSVDKNKTPTPTNPDWIAHNASTWRIDLAEQEQFFVEAEQTTHWKKANLTDLKHPRGWLAKPDAAYDFEAVLGRTDPIRVHLQGNARIRQLEPQALSLQSERLDYARETRLLTTPAPVRLSSEKGWTTGVGLQWWLAAKRLIIQREVHTHYAP